MSRRAPVFLALLFLLLVGCASRTTGTSAPTATPFSTVTASSPSGGASSTPQPGASTPTAPSRPTRGSVPTSAATPGPTTFASRALARTNAYRSQFNCPPLRENAQLEQAALAHSQDMAQHGYFDHNSPSGETPWDRIHAAGYQFSLAAENIAAGYQTPEAVIDAFFNETPPNDGHRRNLLNCGLRDVGFAYFYQKGSPYGSYWTQDFATPR